MFGNIPAGFIAAGEGPGSPAAAMVAPPEGVLIEPWLLTCTRAPSSGASDVSVPTGDMAAWVVFVAAGDTDLTPVHPGRMPFGVTNPIFFEP